ncbi:baseplate protein [Salmonella enterica]|uniref:baseplate protein n=1 Tax=Citrobacter cronae TaxID=1748967 RepID=UPI001820D8E2|nr:baseplate protein [Citrobacter cronae]EAS5032271.1 baseplate protein [Salmonella enterica]EDV2725944.1 baseplate protein [Salmonella enterica subsp. enterica serovar Poona]EAV1590970.1 baseplate protein [Salmonella enterica]EHN7880875.1 baseplate protein [Salmonella enterica]EIA0033868.1 baseplate protein [Salmonella enterica]
MGHRNTRGNKKFLKARYTANVAKGEALVSSEFQLTFRGFENLSVLVRTAQIPEMTREDVEDYGPNGVKYNQHGPIRNSGELQVQCVETIEGDILQFIKDRIAAKDYVDIEMAATPESKSVGTEAKTTAATTIEMLDCKIYSDAIDMSTEDVTAAVRPPLRIVYNWIDWD